MGVPALFRWLSKKYPKIVQQVKEDTPLKVQGEDGELIEVPIKYEGKNPNGFEVDNLYLDMNGIVHPCTHPEGRPAPETEEEMMVEVFKYTERVVNMARPRKLLMMAIDGVAPRAKMNQQRSRRFRSAQEAAEKEEEKKEAIKLFEAMGHTVSDETLNKKAWDSNAITPGTPFMDLLSASLKYWVAHKLNTDPGWKDVHVIISDASVPGEGEHKIMDWIRRQRSHPEHDPNTSHVIYGLDADLIMLALATHEPHFKVLREDVFFQGGRGPNACKICGEQGHFAANCKGEKKIKDPNEVAEIKPVEDKPFIFLDVSCLREYLAVELNLPGLHFQFDLERSIDDWIFLIFFVGNDFLPHLPSLEIREGAIDTLLRIWKTELPRMGGYLTNHGKVEMDRAQIILEGLAKSEDEIFQKRKQDEERQNDRNKRQRRDDHRRQDEAKARREGKPLPPPPGQMDMNGQDYVKVTPMNTARGGSGHPPVPSRPPHDPRKGMDAMGGSNVDVIANRKAIRMANLSAAEALKAELEGSGVTDGPDVATVPGPGDDKTLKTTVVEMTEDGEKEEKEPAMVEAAVDKQAEAEGGDKDMVPQRMDTVPDNEGETTLDIKGEDGLTEGVLGKEVEAKIDGDVVVPGGDEVQDEDEDESMEDDVKPDPNESSRMARKRKRREARAANGDSEEEDDSEDEAPPNPEADQPLPKKKLKANPDGTVDYEDEVKLWEPGYRARYYRSKFGVELSDTQFISDVCKHYIEGLCWVLEYYYQGVPAWDWYYPYHYAPFAQDFQDVGSLKIEFKQGAPFKPFAQLLGVFPAASKVHLPEPLQLLMTEEDSPIIDFYPGDFEIDMNGKKMAWQGVALLPFIDEKRLLSALNGKEDELSEDERRRNTWGNNYMFIAEDNRLYDDFCSLYSLKSSKKPVPIDHRASRGILGDVMAEPTFVPNLGIDSPLTTIDACPDMSSNPSLTVRYYYPKQAHKHRSVLLHGFKPSMPVLVEGDKEFVRRGGNDRRGRGGHRGGASGSGHNTPYGGPGSGATSRGSQWDSPRGSPAPRGGNYGGSSDRYGGRAPPPVPAYAGGGGYGGYGGSAPSAAYGGYSNPYGAPPPNPYAPRPTYGGAPPPPARGGYGGYGGAPPPSRGAPRGGLGGSAYGAPPSRGGYGGYGGNGSGGSYGGYGGYGGQR